MRTRSLFAGLLGAAVLAGPGAGTVLGAPTCATFERIPNPDLAGIEEATLTDVAARDGSAWAIGTLRKDGTTSAVPFVARLADDGWQFAHTPDLSHLAQPVFASIAAAPVGGAWVVGHRLDKPSGLAVPLVLRLNRGFWQEMTVTMASDPKGVVLHDVVVGGGLLRGAWAVGEAVSPHVGGTSPFVARFDGAQWAEFPFDGGSGRLFAVAEDGAGQAWAVGHETLPGTILPEITVAHIAHFDGKTWAGFKHPARRPGTTLHDVVALAADDVWAVGSDGSSGLFLHWDGREWTEQTLPGAAPLSVSGVSGKDVWAVGRSEHYHFDGQSWMTLPAGSDAGLVARRSIAVAGSCAVWTVGSVLENGREVPFAERVTGASVPELPAPPAAVTAAPLAHDKAAIEWKHAGGATAFLVERCDAEFAVCDLVSESVYNVVSKVAPSGTGGSYQDAGLKPQSYYTYRVRAANGAGISEPSDSVTIRTPMAPDVTLPAPPIVLPAEPDGTGPEKVIAPASVPPPARLRVRVAPTPEARRGIAPRTETRREETAAAPAREASAIAAPLPLADPNAVECTAATAEIAVLRGTRLGSRRLQVSFKDALGSNVDALCLPVKWMTVRPGAEVTVQPDRSGKYATVSGAPGRYAIRALAPNGVFAEARITLH